MLNVCVLSNLVHALIMRYWFASTLIVFVELRINALKCEITSDKSINIYYSSHFIICTY